MRLGQAPFGIAAGLLISYFVPEGDGDSQNERLAGAKEFAPRSLPARDIKRKSQHFARAIPAYSANGHRRVQLGEPPSMSAPY
jgi:hypothetical protein